MWELFEMQKKIPAEKQKKVSKSKNKNREHMQARLHY